MGSFRREHKTQRILKISKVLGYHKPQNRFGSGVLFCKKDEFRKNKKFAEKIKNTIDKTTLYAYNNNCSAGRRGDLAA